ncbi:hypothetical protein C9374_004067 [Naegleria lovaniensis]|uniref:TtsA-like Glycoside hydrolase family 108 domain-containing protein n=1 Tax=Naegleria lovaniensis TaxID=51637 RepID=A0AA88GQE4_NAELO|nr:uncharacterized protein C9374_004067 [Naegleria lovaniensis]KAG2383396.1 hypothetical protein C9374_004067 [Naegleria lovaniensis]
MKLTVFALLLALFSACALIFSSSQVQVQALSLPSLEKLIRQQVGNKKFNKLLNRFTNSLLNKILPKEEHEILSDSMWPETRCTNVESALNVRNAPYGSIVRTLGAETQVTVYDVSYANDGSKWAKIGDGQWVFAKYLKMACQNSNNNGDKTTVTLAKIFEHEGLCQNWASDSGNDFQGKIGYTCMGVTPSQCWNNRNTIFSPLYSGFDGHPADFCKYAYDQNPAVYKQCAAQLYAQNYFGPGGCNPLPMPAYYVCADIAVNSGVGRSQQYISELGGYNGQNAKEFARALNEKHRADYKRWGCPTCKNRVFLAGWLARADERDRFIDNY